MIEAISAQQTLAQLDQLRLLVSSGYSTSGVGLVVRKLIETEHDRMQHDLSEIEGRLAEFEQQYGMRSDDFQLRWEAGKLGDAMDMFEWSAHCHMRDSVKRQLEILEESPRG